MGVLKGNLSVTLSSFCEFTAKDNNISVYMDEIEKSLLFYNTFSIWRYFKALEKTSQLSSMLLQCLSRQLQQPFKTAYIVTAQRQTFQLVWRQKVCWKDCENVQGISLWENKQTDKTIKTYMKDSMF